MSEQKPVAIKRILDPEEFADAAIVMCVKGKITALFDAKTGEGGSGKYEYQSGELQDSTGKIKISFSKNTQPKTAKGKMVTITSVKSEQHGWQGIKVEDNSYDKKDGTHVEERLLKITGTANIVYDGEASAGKPSGESKPSSQPQTVSKYEHDLSLHPTNLIADSLAMHKVVDDQVRALYANPVEKAKTPYLYQEETIAAYVATVFIESNKLGAVINFRSRFAKAVPEPKKEYPPAPKDPSKWRGCVIPKGPHEGQTLEDVPDEKLLEWFSFYDKKGDNTPYAECVYQAARDRGILPKKEPEDEASGEDFPE